MARAGKKNVPSSIFTCLKCGEMKVGKHTIKISKNRLDMGGLPITTPGGIGLVTAVADHVFSGITVTLVAGENLTSGQVCYLKSDGEMWLAKADAVLTAGSSMIGLATATINDGDSGVFLLKGFFQDASVYNMTPCKPQFISEATAGVITETPPSTVTNIVRIVGYSKTADIIYFDPDKCWVEV